MGGGRTRTVRCIYCLLDGTSSEEHVVPESLGGGRDLIITDVCQRCNNGTLSYLDQAIAERSLIAITRSRYHSDAVVGDITFLFDEEHHVFDDMRIRGHFKPKLMSQLHLLDNAFRFVTDELPSAQLFVKLVDKMIASNRINSLPIRTDPAKESATSRLVQYGARRLYVRAPDKETADSLIHKVVKAWAPIRNGIISGPHAEHDDSSPKNFDFRFSMTIDDVYRAVAKIALNYVAWKLGADAALGAAFNPIRNYVLGELHHDEPRIPTEILFDRRFVAKADRNDAILLNTDHHLLGLMWLPGGIGLIGIVTLFRSHDFFVRLGPYDAQPNIFEFTEVRLLGAGAVSLSQTEMYNRIRDCVASATMNRHVGRLG